MTQDLTPSKDTVRDEIAFIRRAIEEGRSYAHLHGVDMVVWGVLMGFGYLGNYARGAGFSPVNPNWIWLVCVLAGWLFSIRDRLLGQSCSGPVAPMVRALQMLWLACGVTLTGMALAMAFSAEIQADQLKAISAGVLGIGFFVSAFLTNVRWLRYVAIGWWAGEVVFCFFQSGLYPQLLGAALMFGLLALPGYLLSRKP
ncbi:MAG: hypothetical protein PW790_07055 [Parvibaculaceae bacterium]|nr:hypothetical protein [Parvibaculaceae bacterium]